MGFIYRFAGRWPNGVIPYRAINTWDLSSPLRRIDKALTLPPAILEYQNKTAIEFVPWSGETDYVTFTGEIDTAALSGWCQSTADLFTPAYGKMGGEQTVWCKSFGTDPNSPSDVHIRTTIHEMGHVIGLYHEHQRPDRDSYVSVTGFDPLNLSIITGDTSFSVGDFDCGSVMLYTSINSCTPTSGSSCLGSCVGVPIPGWSAGAPLSLTDGDIASVNFLYPTKSKSSFSWSADWMVTKPVYLGQANDAYAFWYNPNSNSFVISKLIKNGETVVYQSTLSSSATSLVSFKRGSHGYVMAYDKATGNASIYQLNINTGGVGVSLTFSGNIGTNNLSHFEVFDIYGTPFILAYSNVTGAARIYEVSSYGTVVSTSWSQSGWDTDWTHFSSFSHNGTVYLLSYKSLSGRISYTIISYYYDYYLNKWAFGSYPFINFASTPGQNVSYDGIHSFYLPDNPGWGTFQVHSHKGEHYLLLMRSALMVGSGGTASSTTPVQFWKLNINSPSSPWALIGETTWSAGWDTIVPYEIPESQPLGSSLQYMAYKSNLGSASFGKIHAL